MSAVVVSAPPAGAHASPEQCAASASTDSIAPAALSACSPSDLARFMANVIPEPNTGCWLWLGGLTGVGYAAFQVDGRSHNAHRWLYIETVGPVPEGLVLDHFACSQRSCVNPGHLRPVTNAANLARSEKTNGRKTHCPSGHAYTAENTYTLSLTDGTRRYCRACRSRKPLAAFKGRVANLTAIPAPEAQS